MFSDWIKHRTTWLMIYHIHWKQMHWNWTELLNQKKIAAWQITNPCNGAQYTNEAFSKCRFIICHCCMTRFIFYFKFLWIYDPLLLIMDCKLNRLKYSQNNISYNIFQVPRLHLYNILINGLTSYFILYIMCFT